MESNVASSMAGFARAQCNGFAGRLMIFGNLPHAQLYPIITGAHLVVLPSLIDDLPNACLEAMGLGRVVIGTSGSSFEELISDDVNGFLVPRDNPQMLAEKMIAAWIDPRLSEMATAARQRVLEFAPEKTISSLLSYYSEVLSHDRHKNQ